MCYWGGTAMTDSVTVEYKGLRDLGILFQQMAEKGHKRIVPNALRRAAVPMRNRIKELAPVLKPGTDDPRRKPGTLKKSIVLVSERRRKRDIVGVRIKVRALKAEKVLDFKTKTGKSGANNPNDPFYWAAVEKGGGYAPAISYLRRGFDEDKGAFTERFVDEASKEIVKLWKAGK
jgi:hypothetical protein